MHLPCIAVANRVISRDFAAEATDSQLFDLPVEFPASDYERHVLIKQIDAERCVFCAMSMSGEQLVDEEVQDRGRRVSRYGKGRLRAVFYRAVLAVSHNT